MNDLTFPPRLMQARLAAAYLGVSPTKFRTLGLPRKRIGGNVLFDRLDLDAYASAIEAEGEGETCEADKAWGSD